MISLVFLCLSLIILFFLSKFIYKLWLSPVITQRRLLSQGLKGPPYKFMYGSAKELMQMRKEAMSAPFELWQHDIFPRVLPEYDTWIKLYGDNFFFWKGPEPVLVVTEVALVKEILNSKEGIYGKMKPGYLLKKIFGAGIGVAEGEKWSKLRKLAILGFRRDNLKDMVPEMVACVESMMKRWGRYEGKEFEVTHEFKALAAEVVSRTAFGGNYLEGKNIFDMMEKLCSFLIKRGRGSLSLLGFLKFRKSEMEIESDRVGQSLHDSIIALVREREDKVKAGKADNFGNDYLGVLIKALHDTDHPNRISVDELIDECKTLYLAALETSSSAMVWAAAVLSIYTEWQEKAREEVLQVFGKENPTAEGIARLKIVTMITQEVLRLYCPVPYIIRRSGHNKTKLGRYQVPANVEVNIPALALQRNPEIWGQDAHVFNPDRFAQGLAKATNGFPAAFIPFGTGPHSCVGSNFASNEIKIAISMILQRFRLALSPNYVHAPAQIFHVSPQHGLQIILHPLSE